MKSNALIIGGTSGLGESLAQQMADADTNVFVAGRHDSELPFAEYRHLDLRRRYLAEHIADFLSRGLPNFDVLVYNAGFFQEGHITDIEDDHIEDMLSVGARGLMYATKYLLNQQGEIPELITITSTSQFVPREFEPTYNFVKAGAALFTNALSLDPRVGKALVVAPSGMNTSFWSETERDTTKMMDPAIVAQQIQHLRAGEFDQLPLHDTDLATLNSEYRYCFAKILGATADLPQRVEVLANP